MNRFSNRHSASRVLRDIILSLLLCFGMLYLLITVSHNLSAAAKTNQQKALTEALRRSALHCYATEGTYPESLAYLQEHYGISWDKNEYIVDYEINGANLMPGITVLARRSS